MRGRVVAVVLLLGLVPGCGSTGGAADDGGDPPVFVAAQVRAGDGVPGAEVGGEVVLTGGCFGVRVDLGGGDTVDAILVWPAGTTRSDDGVDVPGVGEVHLGDVIDGGGAYVSVDHATALHPRLVECDVDETIVEVATLNPFA